MLGLRRKV